LPTRKKFIYACNIKIYSFGGNEVVEDSLGIALVFEAFLAQEFVEMLEKVIVGWQYDQRAWKMIQIFLFQVM